MKKKSKQLTAWVIISLLLLIYAATFLTAVLDFPGSDTLFRAFLGISIGLPILLWIYIWIYRRIREQRSQAASEHFQDKS